MNIEGKTQKDVAEDWVPDESYYEPKPSASRRRSKDGLSAMEKQYAALPKSVERRIHILGTGNIGKLVAHSLRALPDPPPVTLMFNRYKLLQAWNKGPKQITLHRDGFDIKQTGFDAEVVATVVREHGVIKTRPYEDQPEYFAQHMSNEPIMNLIVTTKSQLTVPALLPVKHRLTSKSTVCLLQNGLGAIDELNEKVFVDPVTRPSYVQGVLTHGVNVPAQVAAEDPFYAVHAGLGTMSLGILPRDLPPPSPSDLAREAVNQDRERTTWAQSSRYVLRTLTRSPVLVAVGYAPTDLFLLQLEKVAVNCIINPLTVLLDARNGALTYNFSLKRTIRLMLAEISLVIKSLPELRGLANIDTRFSASRLESLVNDVAKTTSENISSTLADVRNGRQTEIEYINGYIIRRGEELGIKCVVNYAMMQLVIGKAQMTSREVAAQIPLHPNVKNAQE